jgi:hypothetical protein
MRLRNTVIQLGLAAMLLSLSFPVEAQQKIPRLGYLSGASLSAIPRRIEAFQQGLRELGYVEGKTLLSSGGGQREHLIGCLTLRPS